MNYTHLLWPVPFITFMSAYLVLGIFNEQKTTVVPNIIGRTILHASQELSSKKLGIRIIDTKIDSDLPDGTIISQHPHAQQSVRSGQTIACVVSQHPPQLQTPQYRGLSRQAIEQESVTHGTQQKYFYLSGNSLQDLCFAQYPYPGKPRERSPIIVYLAQTEDKLVIMPDCTKLLVTKAQDFFAQKNIATSVVHENLVTQQHTCQTCIVTQQRPLAGSIIDLNSCKQVQLYVQ